MPAVEAALDRFRAADTQVLGVSIDSIHSHANWARDLGGVSFPLLSDFEPKGAVARSFGHYLADKGITDRATVIIDKQGIARYSESVTPAGRREADALVAAAEKVNGGKGSGLRRGRPLPDGTRLFVKSQCGPSRRALVAIDNLHARSSVEIRNVTEDKTAAAELLKIGGKDQAPCLVLQGKPLYESAKIVEVLAAQLAPLPA